MAENDGVKTLCCSNCERPLAIVMNSGGQKDKFKVRAACCYGCVRDKNGSPEYSYYENVDENYFVAGHGDLVTEVIFTELIDVKLVGEDCIEVFVREKS